MKNLPKDFENFSEARKNGFIEIKKHKDNGKKVAGIYCAFTPHEIISAAGAIPVSLCGMTEEPIGAAERVFPRNICPLIKSSFGHAIMDTCPYFYFADMVVGETTCDGKKKMYEEIAKIKPLHMMYLPKTQFSQEARHMMRHELVRLKENVEEFFNVTVTDEDLSREISRYNHERKALKDFYELGKLKPPPVSGRDIQKVLDGAGFVFESEEYIESLKTVKAEALRDYENGDGKISKSAKRVMITGCPIGGVTEKVLGVIEDAGAVVVAFENCGAIRTTDELVDENIDPIDALAKKYLNTGCACMSPNDNRLKLVEKIIDEYEIDGVVDVVLQACHTFNVETQRIRELVKDKKGKSYITIETDYSKSDTAQLKTRLEAFVEMLD